MSADPAEAAQQRAASRGSVRQGLRGLFAGNADAFAEAGNGYGYTFPAHGRWIPWMRLDRVLTGPGLRPTRAQVIEKRGSDHAGALVEVERVIR